MKYNVTVTGLRWRRKDPMPNPKRWDDEANWEGYQHTEQGVISIEETPCTHYGNGKYMRIVEGFKYIEVGKVGQDIRYDTDYDPDNEEWYIKDYAKYWFAGEGYWKQVDEIKVELIK